MADRLVSGLPRFGEDARKRELQSVPPDRGTCPLKLASLSLQALLAVPSPIMLALLTIMLALFTKVLALFRIMLALLVKGQYADAEGTASKP